MQNVMAGCGVQLPGALKRAPRPIRLPEHGIGPRHAEECLTHDRALFSVRQGSSGDRIHNGLSEVQRLIEAPGDTQAMDEDRLRYDLIRNLKN